MTDTTPPPPNEQSTGSPAAPEILAIHMIPEDVLQRWSALPSGQLITVQITKQDLDNLFFSISNVHMSLDSTNRAFVSWSNKQMIEAQTGLENSRRGLVAGLNSLRFFFEAVISRVVGQSTNA